MSNVAVGEKEWGISFHHVHLYVDSINDIEFYKKLEKIASRLAQHGSFDPFSGGMRFLESDALPERVKEGRSVWEKICKEDTDLDVLDPETYESTNQDIIEQLIIGLGWRVTALHYGKETTSMLVVSQDPKGVKFVVTAPTNGNKLNTEAHKISFEYEHFSLDNLVKFKKLHNGSQGISVLGFELREDGAIEATMAKYKKLHPLLFKSEHTYEDRRIFHHNGESKTNVLGKMQVLEVYAYYKKGAFTKVPDSGTLIRFVHRTGTFSMRDGFGNPQGVLPGLIDVPARFDGTSIPAYADHWVSNVFDREGFLKTLEDVLGFTPKVDFNAGVVAAGRAQIESTVTGNDAGKSNKDDLITDSKDNAEKKALRNQDQIYLPINNALSDVGHVHFFLEQYGQGVQHIASRVKDLVSFIERVNNYRKISGRGFTFLNIPRSYYGRLSEKDLSFGYDESGMSERLFSALVKSEVCNVSGIVDIDVNSKELESILSPILEAEGKHELLADMVETVLASRYANLKKLLGDHFNSLTYLQIVRNKILVDVQGNDVLFQIFTSNILQRAKNDEAPFLEFIQRVCSQKKTKEGKPAIIKPGCGGFGIRNFLTLFLSIEVSKAMNDMEQAMNDGDSAKADKSRSKVELFSRQLDESNPILTRISDAMTAEGDALEEITMLEKDPNAKFPPVSDEIQKLRILVEENRKMKEQGNVQLKELSQNFSKLMEAIDQAAA